MDSYISNHIDKNNLHHAYLIEGNQDIVPEIYKILETLGVNTHNNPDLCIISIDTFKIDDARNLNSLASLKGFSTGKKVFLISTNNFLLEAQNAMLKLFEEPIEDTHFFIITPNIDGLLSTFGSRFYAIRNINSEIVNQDADKFISLSFSERIPDFWRFEL